MSILRKMFKTGNSVVVSVPSYLLAELGLDVNSQVYLDRLYSKKELIGFKITPIISPPRKE